MTQRIIHSPAAALLVAGYLLSHFGQPALAAAALQSSGSPTASPPPSVTPIPSHTAESATDSPSPTALSSTATLSPSLTLIPSATSTPAPDATTSPIAPQTATPTATVSPSATATPDPAAMGEVLIHEVAWSGTLASANDEWIELHNPTANPVNLTGWVLTDDGDLTIRLAGMLAPYSFYLLERTDDSTIADLAADQIYTGSLVNSGESLELRSPDGSIIDTANRSGGAWPAGDARSRASMERLGGDDIPGNWVTFSGPLYFGHDADGNPIRGTPRQPNSPFLATPTPSPSATPGSATPSSTAHPILPGRIMIYEVAWAGTHASASDEWIELHNPSGEPLDLHGWRLTDDGDINILLTGTIAGHSFFLLERSDDSVIRDIPADLIYSGNLRNSGETLSLLSPSGKLIDSANSDGGGWPAGRAGSRGSMERRGGDDRSGNWVTFSGHFGSGHDRAGNPIAGTPRSVNSIHYPTPTPTWIPGRVVINEVLIRPHYDWEGAGGVTTADEFIELYNHGPFPVFLKGWFLDDVSGSGSKPYELPGITISADGYAVFFRSRTRIALNDSGDSVRLLAPDGRLIDEISYLRVRAYNLSYGRLPDGSSRMAYGLWPTPGRANLKFVEQELSEPAAPPAAPLSCPGGGLPWPRVPRLARHPAVARWMWALGHGFCRTGRPADIAPLTELPAEPSAGRRAGWLALELR